MKTGRPLRRIEQHAGLILDRQKVILDEGARCSAAYIKTMAMPLRGYLRCPASRGECRPDIEHAVPPTPN